MGVLAVMPAVWAGFAGGVAAQESRTCKQGYCWDIQTSTWIPENELYTRADGTIALKDQDASGDDAAPSPAVPRTGSWSSQLSYAPSYGQGANQPAKPQASVPAALPAASPYGPGAASPYGPGGDIERRPLAAGKRQASAPPQNPYNASPPRQAPQYAAAPAPLALRLALEKPVRTPFEGRAHDEQAASAVKTASAAADKNSRARRTRTKPPASGKPEFAAGGWVRAEYGAGSRYEGEQGGDRAGVSSAALAAEGSYGNASATLVLGTGDLTGSPGDGNPGNGNGNGNDASPTVSTLGDHDGNAFVAEAYLTFQDVLGTGVSLSGGLQPLFFGLKGQGFAGDRSIQPSVEYGAGGLFAVSNQIVASLIASYELTDQVAIEAGMFDADIVSEAADDDTPFSGDGANITQSYFAQLRVTDLLGTGIYGVAGYQGLFTESTDETESILDFGLGIRRPVFGMPVDVSAEYVMLDQAITQTADDETYWIVESALTPFAPVTFYFDWATAGESNTETIRTGGLYRINDFFDVRLEYSHDDLPDTADGPDDTVSSVDLRVTGSFWTGKRRGRSLYPRGDTLPPGQLQSK